jgi:hypothetical protein
MPKGSSNHVRTVSRSWLWIHFLALSALLLPPSLAAGQQPPLPAQPQLAPEARTRLTEAARDSKLAPWQREFMLGVARGTAVGGAKGEPQPLPGHALPPAGIASVDGDWAQLSFSPPAVRELHTAIYDPVRDRMVVFGGSANGGNLNDVWALSLAGGTAWRNLAPAGTPPSVRYGHAAIYDPVRDRMVVFAGADGANYHNDVWALSLGGSPAWSEITPAGSLPSARVYPTAIYDPVRDRMVVYGGFNYDGAFPNDVWALSLAGSPGWSQLGPAGGPPLPRFWHTAIYDPVRDRMVVFGGVGEGFPFGPYFNDVWALSLAGSPAWTVLFGGGQGGGVISPRGLATAIYDPVRDRMMVFGGSATSFYNDVWQFSLTGGYPWIDYTPTYLPGNPSGRLGHSAIYDPVRDRMVVFGGYDNNGFCGDVWALSLAGTPGWGAGALAPGWYPPSARFWHTAIYDAVRDRIIVFGGVDASGGSGNRNDVWELSLAGNPAWRELSPAGTPPPPRRLHVAIYDPVRDRMVVFGGFGNYPTYYLKDVWALSLAGNPTWSEISPGGSTPSARWSPTAIYDPVRDRMVVFGGTIESGGSDNDVWALSLAGSPAWSELTPAGSPPSARSGHTAIYDPVRDRMVVFGGYGTSNRNDVWALALAASPAWSELGPAGGPPPARAYHTATYDPVHDRMVVFGGSGGGFLSDTWVLLNPPDTTPPNVALTFPNGGETLDSATPITIAWTASDNGSVAHVDVYASTNGGSTYSLLAPGESNDGSYGWSGAAPTTQCRVRVVAFDGFGNSAADASDGNFTISDPAPPPVPAPFTGVFSGGPVQLHWGASTAGDFGLYHLHRGGTASFVPGPGNLVASQPDTGFVDAGSTWSYYKLSALDVLGHESGFALLTPASLAAGSTPADSNVVVTLASNVQLTFQNVTSGGQSQLTLQTGGSPPPNGLKLAPSSPPLYYVLSTTATFTGSVTVCITYDPANVSGPEANLRLMHFDTALAPPSWQPVTTSRNVAANVICGTVTHFSEFALMEADPTVAVDDGIPSAFLLRCAPNPISGSAQVQYDLPVASPVALGLFDLQGRLVRELDRRHSAGPGRYVVQWDGRGVHGERVRAGIYFLRLEAGTFHQVRRVVVTE